MDPQAGSEMETSNHLLSLAWEEDLPLAPHLLALGNPTHGPPPAKAKRGRRGLGMSLHLEELRV